MQDNCDRRHCHVFFGGNAKILLIEWQNLFYHFGGSLSLVCMITDEALENKQRIDKDVVIIGGGLSGLTTAYFLAPTFNVTVLETDASPGGQVRAFRVKGTTVEHGSHVFFGYYKNSLDLLAKAGLPNHLVQVPGWTIVNEKGQQAVLQQSKRLPGLFSLLPLLFRIPWFSTKDRLRGMVAAYRFIKAPYSRWPEADQKTARDAGIDFGYTLRGVETWNAATHGLTNLFVDEQSGAIFAGMHKVLVGSRQGLSYQIPDMNLSELFSEPLSHAVEERGGTVRLKHKVTQITRIDDDPEGHECKIDFRNDDLAESMLAHYTILAVQPQDAAILATWIKAPWTTLHRVTPIITMTLGLSGEITASRDAREYGLSRRDWIFSVITDLSRFWPEFSGKKTVLRVEIGHADLLPGGIAIPDEKLIPLVKKDLDRLWPECAALDVEFAKRVGVSHHLYVSWNRGEVMKKPNMTMLKDKKGDDTDERDLGNHVYLAGDWTTKGTIGMEAAVNSAIEAANFVHMSEHLASIPFEDVPVK